MCLIITLESGQTVPEWVIESALEYNADGLGIMAQGKARKFMGIKASHAKQLINEEFLGVDRAVHFRMATDGKINKANCHPFPLKNRGYLMHNGILSAYRTTKDSAKSDTRRFVEEFCNVKIAKHGSIPTSDLEKEIVGNAICLMDKSGNISRYGSRWVEYFGCWFSNEYAWDAPVKYPTRVKSKPSWWAYSADDYSDFSVRDSDDWYGRPEDDYCADLVASRLMILADDLPLATPDHVYYQDLDLWDELLSGTLQVEDFLGVCSADTLLNLYTWAASEGYTLS